MKVFITGIAGLIGSNLARQLLHDGIDVVGCDNLSGGYKDNVPAGVEFFEIDCSSPEVMLALKDCNILYHTAAHAYEGLSNFSPCFVVNSIVNATSNLLSAAINSGTEKFVFCSSMARYGRQKPPFDESMSPQPVDPYGIAKVAGEQLVASLCKFHGMRYTIVVPHNVFGVGQRYDDPYRNVIAIMLNRMLQNLRPIIYGDGSQVRSFTPIQDAVAPLLTAGLSEQSDNMVINIGTGPEHAINMRDLVALVNRILGTNFDPIHIEQRPNEVIEAYCTNDLSQRILNYIPKNNIEEELTRMAAWIRARGPKPFCYDRKIEINSERVFSAWHENLL